MMSHEPARRVSCQQILQKCGVGERQGQGYECGVSVNSSLLTLLHLGDQVLVEQTTGLLVERAVDGDNIALRKHLLEVLDTTAANLLLLLGRERLVVEVEELLAVEGLETAEDALTNAANSNGADDLVLKIILVLGHSSDVPVTRLNLLVSGNEVPDEGQDGHDDVLGDRDDVGTSDLSDGQTAVRLVRSIEVDVVGTDTSSHAKLQVLGLGETLLGDVAGVETVATLAQVRTATTWQQRTEW